MKRGELGGGSYNWRGKHIHQVSGSSALEERSSARAAASDDAPLCIPDSPAPGSCDVEGGGGGERIIKDLKRKANSLSRDTRQAASALG